MQHLRRRCGCSRCASRSCGSIALPQMARTSGTSQQRCWVPPRPSWLRCVAAAWGHMGSDSDADMSGQSTPTAAGDVGMPDVQQQPEQRQLEQQRRRRQRQQQLQADQQRERLAKDLLSNVRRPRKPKSRASKQLQSAVAAAVGAATGEAGVPVQRRSTRTRRKPDPQQQYSASAAGGNAPPGAQ
jgi:hypothetical protein